MIKYSFLKLVADQNELKNAGIDIRAKLEC